MQSKGAYIMWILWCITPFTCLFLKISQWENCGLLKSWVKFYLMQPCISPVPIFLRTSFCTLKDRSKHVHTSTLAISEMLHVQVLDFQIMDGKMHLQFPFNKYINRTKLSHDWRTIWLLPKGHSSTLNSRSLPHAFPGGPLPFTVKFFYFCQVNWIIYKNIPRLGNQA